MSGYHDSGHSTCYRFIAHIYLSPEIEDALFLSSFHQAVSANELNALFGLTQGDKPIYMEHSLQASTPCDTSSSHQTRVSRNYGEAVTTPSNRKRRRERKERIRITRRAEVPCCRCTRFNLECQVIVNSPGTSCLSCRDGHRQCIWEQGATRSGDASLHPEIVSLEGTGHL